MKTNPCFNCGNDLNYHSETQTDICLKKLNQKISNFICSFDSLKKVESEVDGLVTLTSDLTIHTGGVYIII